MKESLNRIYNLECLEGMQRLLDKYGEGCIDMILCDLPYGTTRNKWDSIIPLDELWEVYKKLIKPNGAIVLFSQGLFSAKLIMSNEKWWRYNLIWEKNRPSGFLNAKKMPLRSHEEIQVFYQKPPNYTSQMYKGKPNHSVGTIEGKKQKTMNNYGDNVVKPNDTGDMKHPRSVLKFDRPHPPIFPTQKPVDLIEWLIKAYTNDNDIILDNCMGSGTTAIAAINTNRNFIGFEKDEDNFKLSNERIAKHAQSL